jgi:hypothetical protein
VTSSAGTVISQSPAPDTVLTPGAAVAFVLSTDSSGVPPPITFTHPAGYVRGCPTFSMAINDQLFAIDTGGL